MIDVRRLRPAEALRLLNASNVGQAVTERELRDHMNLAGVRIGNGKSIDLLRYSAWLRASCQPATPRPSATVPPTGAADYARHRDDMARKSSERSRQGREIGAIPPVADPARRTEGMNSLLRFCEIYFPNRFPLAWSDDHRKVLAKMESVIRLGGLFALAMPRGSGKTTIVEVACLFALFFGFRHYIALIGSAEEMAKAMLDSIKVELENNDLLLADFPEVCFPIRQLERISNRARGQLCQDRPTSMTWKHRELVLPTVDGSAASGGRIQVAGLTGAIRGMKHTRNDGTVDRPDLVIPDDPQTDESAKSPEQCNQRERLIAGAVLGLGGPGKKISGFMPCTVVEENDMADRILDRKKHPVWHGERMQMIYRWPTGKSAEKHWKKYAELRRTSQENGGKGEQATAYYEKHRGPMDGGAIVAWEAKFEEDELSTLQSAWNIRIDRGDRAFFAEYQNTPIPDEEKTVSTLTAAQICSRTNNLKRGEVPVEASTITAFIDVQKHMLVWLVAAWEPDFTGYVIDYGTFPDQKSLTWKRREPKHTLERMFPTAGAEARLRGGLDALTNQLLQREFTRKDRAVMRISRTLIDYGWGDSAEIVRPFCRDSRWAATLIPSKGEGIGPASRQYSEYRQKRGDRVGLRWIIPAQVGRNAVRQLRFDSNWWKSFIHSRFGVALGDAGALSVWGSSPQTHTMFADHLLAERCHVLTDEKSGVSANVWMELPGRENDLFDCMVGAAVAASIEGVRVPGIVTEAPPRQESISLRALQDARRRRAS